MDMKWTPFNDFTAFAIESEGDDAALLLKARTATDVLLRVEFGWSRNFAQPLLLLVRTA